MRERWACETVTPHATMTCSLLDRRRHDSLLHRDTWSMLRRGVRVINDSKWTVAAHARVANFRADDFPVTAIRVAPGTSASIPCGRRQHLRVTLEHVRCDGSGQAVRELFCSGVVARRGHRLRVSPDAPVFMGHVGDIPSNIEPSGGSEVFFSATET